VAENRTYCTKDGDYFESGVQPTQGGRNDLEEIKRRILAGDPLWEVITDNVNNGQQLRFATQLHGLRQRRQRRTEQPVVYWFWGPTGTGKTRAAIESDPEAYISSARSRFWNGYEGQTVVILDDLRGDTYPYCELLRILDRYPYNVEVKGDYMPLLATKIYITAPFAPENYPQPFGEDNSQLMRRITHTQHFE